MKKALTVLVIFAIVLSLSATAFADNGGIKITKDPTDEYHFIGETAAFVANARKFSGLTWTVVDPDGDRCTVDEFRSYFPYSTVTGDTTGTLIINNVHADMDGYRFFCTFSNSNGAESSAEAVLHIIYQGKELDIPQGYFDNLIPPDFRPDYGRNTYPSLTYDPYW